MYSITSSPFCESYGIPDPAASNFTNDISMLTTRGMFQRDFSSTGMNGWTQVPLHQSVYPVNVARIQTTGHELESCHQQVYKPISIKSERTLVTKVEHLKDDTIRRTSPPKYYAEQYSPKDCALTLNSPQDFKMTMPPPHDFTIPTPSPQDFTITPPSSQDCGVGSSSRNFESVTSSPPDYETTYPHFDPYTLDFERSAFSIPNVPPFQGYQLPPADCDSTHQPTTSPKFSDLQVQQQHYQRMNQQRMRLYQLQQQQPPQLQQQHQSKLNMESAAIKSTTPRRKPSASIGGSHSLIPRTYIMFLLQTGRTNQTLTCVS